MDYTVISGMHSPINTIKKQRTRYASGRWRGQLREAVRGEGGRSGSECYYGRGMEVVKPQIVNLMVKIKATKVIFNMISFKRLASYEHHL